MRRSEPVFKAPWTAVVLLVSIPLLYSLQIMAPDSEALDRTFALSPLLLWQGGQWWTLLTYMGLHGGWVHALFNASAALAFGPAAAKLFGTSAKGAIGFFSFYIVCGLVSGLGFALLHASDLRPVVGASGALSGLIGAAFRLLNTERRLAPILSRGVVSATCAFVVINVVLGVTNSTPGAEGLPVAWEAHLVGYFAGLLLIGPWASWFAPAPTEEPQEQSGPF